jgi:hypothetical protein
MNWCKQHLNWTYIFSLIGVIVAFVLGFFIWAVIGDNTNVDPPGYFDLLTDIAICLLLLGFIVVPVWVLWQKGGGFWNFILYFIGLLFYPLAILYVLHLENRRVTSK